MPIFRLHQNNLSKKYDFRDLEHLRQIEIRFLHNAYAYASDVLQPSNYVLAFATNKDKFN